MENRPTKCKAAFMHGPFDLRIEELELPPLRPDLVPIKLRACGICQSDVECFEGKSAEGRCDIAPYTPGHEWVGTAVEVGSDCTCVKAGDKVVGDCVLPCHKCANCTVDPTAGNVEEQIKDTYDFKGLASHYYKFEDLAAAMEMAQNKQIAKKVMLVFPE